MPGGRAAPRALCGGALERLGGLRADKPLAVHEERRRPAHAELEHVGRVASTRAGRGRLVEIAAESRRIEADLGNSFLVPCTIDSNLITFERVRPRDGTDHAFRADMSKPIPTIQKFMTTAPHSIGRDQTLAKAHSLMHEYGIRHLPVLHGGALVGILTDRDLHLVESFKDVDPNKVMVEEAMSPIVYEVAPDAPLDEVVKTMGAHKYGSAIVVQNGKVVGIFTTVDLCNTLAELLQTRLAVSPRRDANA